MPFVTSMPSITSVFYNIHAFHDLAGIEDGKHIAEASA